MPSPTYAVKNWSAHFETAETRKLKNLRWVPIPNKHDGLGYRRVAAQTNAAELFAAWILILEVCSKGPPEQRGHLLREQDALGANHLAMMTGFPADMFQRALEFFSSPQQGWLIVEGQGETKSPVVPADAPAFAGSSPAEWKEGKGMEGEEGGSTPPDSSERSDERWLADMQAHSAYVNIDVPAEYAACRAHCRKVKKRCTRGFFAEWLARVEPEMGLAPATPEAPKQPVKADGPTGWRIRLETECPGNRINAESLGWEHVPQALRVRIGG